MAYKNGNRISALASYKGELYAGGQFADIGGLTNVYHIARWNGTQWRSVSGGVRASLPQVYCMAVYKGELYVGGNIYHAGSVDANYIARWDGSQWKAVGKGFNYVVQSLVVDSVNNVLYAGGAFSTCDTTPCRVAMWDGIKMVNGWKFNYF